MSLITNHGIIGIPSPVIAAAESIKFENYKTNTPKKFQIQPLHSEGAEQLMDMLAYVVGIERNKLDFVYFSVCKGAEEHTDLLDPNVFEPRTFVIPVILPTGKSIITAQDEQLEVAVGHIYEFNHEEPHSMILEDCESGCVVIMVAVKKDPVRTGPLTDYELAQLYALFPIGSQPNKLLRRLVAYGVQIEPEPFL